MKLALLLLFLIIIFYKSAVAQNQYVFAVDSIDSPKVAVTSESCRELSCFGSQVSLMYQQFNQTYTRTIDCGAPTHYSSIEIDKPDLYYSIKKLSKYYTKRYKKGQIDKEEAENNLQEILKKCLAIHALKTSLIEHELKAANNPEEIVSVFGKIVIE